MFKQFLTVLVLVTLLVIMATVVTATEGEEVFVIGGIHPLTGGLAADGIQMDNAAQMAVDEINEMGGINGIMLAYAGADSTGSAELGQTEAERLIEDGAGALIGTFQSAVTSNVAAIAEREGIPMVIDVAVADAILDQGYEYVFRLQPNATSMGVNGAIFLQQMAEAAGEDISTVVYMYEGDTDYGQSVYDAFAIQAEELGIEIVEEIPYGLSVTDLTTDMTLANAAAADVLVVTGYYNDGLLVARNAEEVGIDVRFVYGVAQGTYDQSQFVEDAGDLAECFFNANYYWDASDEMAAEVRAKFMELYGEDMRTSAVLAYQSVYIIADALSRAESTEPEAVRDALAETEYEDHILPYDGPITFDETGETETASPVVMQVQEGTVVQVFPPELAEGDTTPNFCTSWGG